ncbi:MAG: ABC transporter permease [Bryobacterales bacterium]|nr:ABC transporter permease [Bryobacterales bacterium]MDE0264276.1 ABC transporter permease [Bryobacterales bacterium]MDE0620384.1 ABC transporter permease [Bryobacterales bacterium]
MTLLESVGRFSIRQAEYIGRLAIQFWYCLRFSVRASPFQGRGLRWQRTLRQMGDIGVRSLPVLCLVSGATGMIMALQAGAELRRFGAMEAIVTMVGTTMTRELGPLMAAIVVIGRSGSAISAEVATMAVTEELDALRAMALDPIDFVLVPKYLAMLVMLPCLTVMSVFSGILAGGVFAYFTLDLTLLAYLSRTAEILLMRDIVSGLVKAVIFGSIIVHVSCLEGFTVSGGPVGVGHSTTSAVVKSIFLVVLADLLCTTFFYFFWR